MEYKILGHTNENQLESIVRNHLKEGWKPQGGIAVAVKSGVDAGYFQAVVR